MKKEAVPRGIAFVLYAHFRHSGRLVIGDVFCYCGYVFCHCEFRGSGTKQSIRGGLVDCFSRSAPSQWRKRSPLKRAMTKTFSAGTRNGAKVFSWNAQWRKSFQLERAMAQKLSAGTRNDENVFRWNAQWRKSFQLERAMTKTFSAGTRNDAKVFS